MNSTDPEVLKQKFVIEKALRELPRHISTWIRKSEPKRVEEFAQLADNYMRSNPELVIVNRPLGQDDPVQWKHRSFMDEKAGGKPESPKESLRKPQDSSSAPRRQSKEEWMKTATCHKCDWTYRALLSG